jgi:tRNA threonylcarbamoyladenosine biosynthesis protein TsaB
VHESLLGLEADGSPGHATRLLEEAEAAVAAAGGWQAIDTIAVGVGPGSFTGLRVGLASARGLGAALGLPLVGVCTLDALARGIEQPAAGRDRLALLDARRGEVFAALYAPSGERIWGPWVGTPDILRERLARHSEPPLAAGSGALRFSGELASCGVELAGAGDLHRVAARHVCAIAAAGGGDRLPPEPIYLRPPDAERWHERDDPPRDEQGRGGAGG